jgi:ABC-type phosphate/phosphonate transport system substrate-binding protein
LRHSARLETTEPVLTENDVVETVLLANARMYSVTGAAAAAWRDLLGWISVQAGLPLTVVDHPAPKPLGELWERNDLGCALMCGLARTLSFPCAQPIAAPVVAAPRYKGLPIYFTDIVVRASSPFQTLEDTFGSRVGFTVRDSHSGYVALREHLLPYRKARGTPLFREVVGSLISPRGVVAALLDDRIDVGPLDSYAHDLIRTGEPRLADQLRTVATTAPTPIPLFVATAPIDDDMMQKLQDAFAQVAHADRLQPVRDALLVRKFETPTTDDYETFHARSAASDRYPDPW